MRRLAVAAGLERALRRHGLDPSLFVERGTSTSITVVIDVQHADLLRRLLLATAAVTS